VLHEPTDHAHEVLLVNPRDHLPAVADGPAQTPPHEAQQDLERAAGNGAHHDRRAQRDAARVGHDRAEQRVFPSPHYAQAESPEAAARIIAADPARRLVVGGVVAMSVNGRAAHLEPGARRAGGARNRFTHDARGQDA